MRSFNYESAEYICMAWGVPCRRPLGIFWSWAQPRPMGLGVSTWGTEVHLSELGTLFRGPMATGPSCGVAVTGPKAVWHLTLKRQLTGCFCLADSRMPQCAPHAHLGWNVDAAWWQRQEGGRSGERLGSFTLSPGLLLEPGRVLHVENLACVQRRPVPRAQSRRSRLTSTFSMAGGVASQTAGSIFLKNNFIKIKFIHHIVIVVQSFSRGRTHCNPRSAPGFPVLHHLPEFAQTHVRGVDDTIQPSHPLLSPSPPALNLFQHQGFFQWVGFSHQVVQYAHLKCTIQWFYNKFTELCTQPLQSILDYFHYLQKKPVTPCSILLHLFFIPALGNY